MKRIFPLALLLGLFAGIGPATPYSMLFGGVSGASGVSNAMTIVMGSTLLPGAVPTAEFGGILGSSSVGSGNFAASSPKAVVLPFAGTFKNTRFHLGTAVQTTETITIGGSTTAPGVVVSGSPNITWATSQTITAGTTVTGAGIPGGTTILSGSGTAYVMSANATATPAKTSVVTIADQFNAVDQTAGCSTTAGGQDCNGSNSDHNTVPGTLLQWHATISSADGLWSQSAWSQLGFTYTADNGNHIALFVSPSTSGIGASPAFLSLSIGVGDTALNTEGVLCSICGGTVVGIYGVPNSSPEGGGAHTYSIAKNGVQTASSCDAVIGTSTGCCANPTAAGTIGGTLACTNVANVGGVPSTPWASTHFNPGDAISVDILCPSAACTRNILPGLGIDWVPDTPGVTPMFTLIKAASFGTIYQGVNNETGTQNTQVSFQMAPVNLKITNGQICTTTAITGTQTRTMTMQVGSTGSAPTTPGTPIAPSMNLASGAGPCTGSYVSGASDSHTQLASAGQTLDIQSAGVGVSAGLVKFSGAMLPQ